MYKKQMVFEKVACFCAIIAAAITFIYSLGIITDIYDSLYSTMRNPSDLTQTDVPGSIIYYDMQGFNKTFMHAGLVLILLAVLLFITNTHIRRKYYSGNIVSSLLYSVATIAVTIWSSLKISAFKKQFLTTVDFEALKVYAETWQKTYSESTFFFDIHYFVLLVNLAAAGMILYNLYWKNNMMKQEEALLKGGQEAVS